MSRSSSWLSGAAVLLATAALTAVTVAPGSDAASTSSTTTSAPMSTATATSTPAQVTSTTESIPVRDGVTLTATVFTPVAAPTGRGWPLVVIPGTFAGNGVSVDPIAQLIAQRGYVAVSYLERGWSTSGQLNGGGPRDVADVSDVVTWALANRPTDPGRVGLAALSYGGGIVLQAGVADHRVRAVAEIAGWADMEAAFYPNRTPAQVTLQSLYGLASLTGRIDAETTAAFTGSINRTDIPGGVAYARARSVARQWQQPGAHRPAIFMSHEMNETVFQVDQSVAFWNAYTGVKHLDLRPGDHGSQELGTTTGNPGTTWLEVMRWLDAYVAGTDTSIAAEPAVLVEPRSPKGSHAIERYAGTQPARWSRRWLTTTSGLLGATHTLTETRSTTATTTTLREGTNWLVHVLAPMWTYAQEATTGTPPNVALPLVDRTVTQLWTSPPLTARMALRGAARVHLTLTPSAATGTVVVHLLDVDGTTGYLVAHQPYTWTAATPGRPTAIDLEIPWNAFDLPVGHRLGVVVTTSDPSFHDSNPAFSTVRIGPDSWVDVPLR